MRATKFGFSGAALMFLLAGSATARAADEVVSYAVRAVTSRGVEFSGLVPRTKAFDGLLGGSEGGDSIDPASIDPKQRLKLSGVNGLSGSATFYYGGLKSIRIVGRLTEQDLKQRKQDRASARKNRLEREQVRLAQIKGRREAARSAEQGEQERRQQTKKPVLSEEHQQWIDRFPPDKGWIPAKKARLYYQTVILNNRPQTDDERAWLDAYEQWKPAYDAWLVLEQQKLAAEQAAREAAEQGVEGPEPPTGNDRPDPSGTSASPGAGIAPDEPTPEQQKQLPPPLDPKTPKPEKISDKAPKPVPLKPYAVKPDPLEAPRNNNLTFWTALFMKRAPDCVAPSRSISNTPPSSRLARNDDCSPKMSSYCCAAPKDGSRPRGS